MKRFYTYSFNDYTIFQTPNLWNTYQNYNYILEKNNEAIIFDPGDYEPINRTIKENKLNIKAIYLTHHHQDHIDATKEIQKEWDCPVYGFTKDKERLPKLSHQYNENDKLNILGLEAEVLFFPAHTTGLCAFYFKEQNWLFSSDLIFSLGCGRVFEGTFKQMQESLERACSLPDKTLIFSSHEFTLANLQFGLSLFKDDPKLLSLIKSIEHKGSQQEPTVPTLLSFEKEHNPFLRWSDSYIRKTLNMEGAKDWEVFAHIRKLKDQF